jgi:16S rRNA processing protein RimM
MIEDNQIPPNSISEAKGSPQSGEPFFLAIGYLRRPHGLTGEILMEVLTDFPQGIHPHRTVYVGEDHLPMKITKVREQGQALLVTFKGITNPEDAGKLRKLQVYTKSDTLRVLPEGEFYHHQLIGLSVIDQNGQLVGVLTEIIETGANDVYIITGEDGKETLLPAIASTMIAVNLEKQEMNVKLPDWE